MSHPPLCVPPARNPVRLIHRDGQTWTFTSIHALGNALSARISRGRAQARNWDLDIGLDFVERLKLGWNVEPQYRSHDYVVRDDFGNKICRGDIPGPPRTKRAWYAPKPAYFWRQDPIEGTGKHRWRYSSALRYPKTQAERRAAFDPIEEHEPRRNRRRQNEIPTSWGDRHRAPMRNWKLFRNQQWKD